MQKIEPLFRLSILFFLLVAVSCSSADDAGNITHYETRYATSVDASSEGFVGEKINIVVSFVVMNGCGGFGRFIESGNELTRTIGIEAKYEGYICTNDLPIRQATYEFIPDSSGE